MKYNQTADFMFHYFVKYKEKGYENILKGVFGDDY